MLFEVLIMFQIDYLNDDHNQHDDVQLDLKFRNDAEIEEGVLRRFNGRNYLNLLF